MSEHTYVVELKGVPIGVHLRAEEHTATLNRELALIHAADQTGPAPARLLWLTQELADRYEAFNAAPAATLADASAGEDALIDLRYEVPADAVDVVESLGALLEEVDEFCRNGNLLTLVTPPESVAYRRWFYGEFTAQIRDRAAPTPWQPSPVDMAAIADEPPAEEEDGGAATVTVSEDLDLEGAARIRGDITAALDRGVTDLTIDLTRCEFVDSVGISLLVTTLVRMRDLGGSLVVTGVSGHVRRTLETAGVFEELTTG